MKKSLLFCFSFLACSLFLSGCDYKEMFNKKEHEKQEVQCSKESDKIQTEKGEKIIENNNVILEKEKVKVEEKHPSNSKVEIIDQAYKISFEKNDVKIEDGKIDVKLNIDVQDNWIIYSDQNVASIGKPFNVKFYLKDCDGKKEIFDNDIIKTAAPEHLVIVKKGEMIGSEKDIEIKIFPKESTLNIELKNNKIKKDDKFLMEVSGAACEKEKNNGEPEICLPINHIFELN